MALTEVQGALLLHEFSLDGVTNWKSLVCAQGGKSSQKSNVTTEKTKCGTIKGVDDPDWSMSGDAVANITPGANEISLNTVNSWIANKQKVYIRIQSPADAVRGTAIGEDYYRSGSGYFGSVDDDLSNGVVVKFSWTFEGDGILATVQPLTIATQPTTPINIAVGATLSITGAAASGGSKPLTYQWKKGGVNISGATSATFTKANAQTGDSGSYTLVVTDAVGTTQTTSASAVTVS